MNSPSPRNHPGSYLKNSHFLQQDGSSPEGLRPESSRGSSFGDETDGNFGQNIKDPRIQELVSRHLRTDDSTAWTAEGGDITRDVYKLNQTSQPPLRRSRSWSLADLELGLRRGSTASSLNVPGGFRRQFLLSHAPNNQPSFVTRNFVEFLSIYGHFAGEDLEDDSDVACHYKAHRQTAAESQPLLGSVNPSGTASDTKAYFLLLKAFVGTGVLFLPRAFASGGLVASCLTLTAFGLISYWCYLILVYAKLAVGVSSFGEIGLRCYGRWLQQLILFSILLLQIGFVAAYIVFTAENLRAFICNVLRLNSGDYDIVWFILFEAAVLTPMSLIRDITRLSLAALLANFLILVGLVTILYYTLAEFVHNRLVPAEGIHYLFNKNEFSLFIGVAIFAFEGIGLIIPIQESMIYPHNFPKVLFQVIATISFIFVFVGTFGYLTFGSKIETVILLNLPQGSPFVMLIQLVYALAILLSTPIQIFPAVRLIELRLFSQAWSGKASSSVKWSKNAVRFLFVALASIIAIYGGRNLDKFVSFVGCFACIPLVYMYPPMLHLKACCGNGQNRTLAILDYILIVLGGVALVYTTYDIIRGL